MTVRWTLKTGRRKRFMRVVRIPKVGDVMRAPSGLLRIVRRVEIRSLKQNLRDVHINFVIKHCSWTHRPVTGYSYGELLCLGYRLTAGHVELNLPSDKLIEYECGNADKPTLTCCDVEGIA